MCLKKILNTNKLIANRILGDSFCLYPCTTKGTTTHKYIQTHTNTKEMIIIHRFCFFNIYIYTVEEYARCTGALYPTTCNFIPCHPSSLSSSGKRVKQKEIKQMEIN